MPFRFALLTSLFLHLALIIAPAWLARHAPAARQRHLEARLLPPMPSLSAPFGTVSTEAQPAAAGVPVPVPAAAPPKKMRGAALQRAQSALSKQLFYPPEAVAAGLEGEVVLLLTLAEGGRIIAAEIARSSGHPLLDQAALAAVGQIGALPGNSRQTLLPVSFRLH
jgi:protein TonB